MQGTFRVPCIMLHIHEFILKSVMTFDFKNSLKIFMCIYSTTITIFRHACNCTADPVGFTYNVSVEGINRTFNCYLGNVQIMAYCFHQQCLTAFWTAQAP